MPLPFLAAAAFGAVAGTMAGSWLRRPRAGNFEAKVDGDGKTETLTAHQIYERVRGGVGFGPLVEAGIGAGLLEGRYAGRAEQIKALRERMASAWQGSASDASFARTQPLLDTFDKSRDLLFDSGRPLSSQIDAFGDVFKKVQDVPAEPPKSSLLNDVNPFNTDTDKAIAAYNTKANNNVQAYLQYNVASTDNGGRVPQQYPTLPAGGLPPVVVTGSGTAGYGRSGLPAVSPAGASPAPAADGSALPTRPGDRPTHGGSPVPDRNATAAQSFVPEPNAARGGTPTTPSSTGSGPGATPIAGAFTGSGGRNANGLRSGSDAGPLPGVGGGANPTGQAGRGTTSVPGQRAGATPLGGPPGPAGRGKGEGEEDTEHKNKYTTSPDPKELFGTDELYVEPVIGDDR